MKYAPRFCFRIAKEADLANDSEGNSVACFTEVIFEGGENLTEAEYNEIHNAVQTSITKKLNIPTHYLECISVQEYDENH